MLAGATAATFALLNSQARRRGEFLGDSVDRLLSATIDAGAKPES